MVADPESLQKQVLKLFLLSNKTEDAAAHSPDHFDDIL